MEKSTENGVALGLVFGVAVGAATDNIGLWLCLGIALGPSVFSRIGSDPEEEEESASENPPIEGEDEG